MLSHTFLLSDYVSAADAPGQDGAITRFREVIPVPNKQRKLSSKRRASSAAANETRGPKSGAQSYSAKAR